MQASAPNRSSHQVQTLQVTLRVDSLLPAEAGAGERATPLLTSGGTLRGTLRERVDGLRPAEAGAGEGAKP